MDRFTKVIFLVLVAIALDRVCTIIPARISINDPFPFYYLSYTINGVEYHSISLQAYIKLAIQHVSWIVLLFAFRIALPVRMEMLLTVMIVIEFLSLADFFLIYEQYLFQLGNYPVEFTDFRVLGHAVAILLWKMERL